MIFGKIFGAILGYASFGWIGLIVGTLVGHWFDKGLIGSISYAQEGLLKSRQIFFQSTFEIMGAVAKADGHVSQAEIEVARSVMRQLNLNAEEQSQAIAFFTAGKSPNYNLEEALIRFKQFCGRDENLVRFFLEIQLQVALTEGHLKKSVHHILNKICEALGISTYFIDELTGRSRAEQDFYNRYSSSQRATPKAEVADAYGVLGLQAQATPIEIKKAYRRLMSQHHPDKLAAKGLPESMKKMATEKTQRIQKAYEIICEKRGI